MPDFIPVNEPLLSGNEKKYLSECIDSGWISSEGSFVQKFEEEFANFTGVSHGIAVSNGTAALETALFAVGIQQGDEVIMSTFTIISCAIACLRLGAVPVFVIIGAFAIFGHRITWQQGIGITATLTGVVIVASRGNPAALADFAINRGDFFMLIACFLYAAYSLALNRCPRVSPLGLFSIMSMVAWLISLPLIGVEIYLDGWHAPTPKGWLLVVLITLLPSLLAQLFYIFGVKIIGPGRAGAFYNLVPVFASLFAVVIFQGYHALALTLVLGGIWLSEKGKPQSLP